MDPYNAQLNQLIVSTYKAVVRVEELMLRDMSNNDLSNSEMHMLESIGKDAQNGMHITDIAQDQKITLPSVTTAIQKLERKGYVTKQKNANDGRRVRVMLTEKGRRAEIAHRYFHRTMVHAVSKGMDERQKEALMQGFMKLNEFLQQRIADTDTKLAEGANQ